jgi:translation initiation factor 2B subunit (eIF-2B alpha/beta/delta family)
MADRSPQAILDDALQRIRADREHGASWLARTAAGALAEACEASAVAPGAEEALRQVHTAARALAHARPSMAALANTVAHIWAAGAPRPDAPRDAADVEVALARMREAARVEVALWSHAADEIFTAARAYLSAATLLTHSRSGTVEHVLTRLAADAPAGEPHAIFVTESRPGGEGVALAGILAAAGWRVTLIADMACGLFMGQARAVVAGADSVRADGGVVNKVGTYPLALAAHAAGVPLYILCETRKIAAAEYPLTFEEMDAAELLPRPMPGIVARNPYFDLTPARLVTGVVTERGTLSQDEIRAIAMEAARSLAALDTLNASLG